jgi:hypothetical protein
VRWDGIGPQRAAGERGDDGNARPKTEENKHHVVHVHALDCRRDLPAGMKHTTEDVQMPTAKVTLHNSGFKEGTQRMSSQLKNDYIMVFARPRRSLEARLVTAPRLDRS